MSYLDHGRSWYPANGDYPAGDPVVRSSSGSQRPPLATPLDTFTVHYIGAGRTWLDVGDTARELASIESGWAIPQKKPNEYNSASDSECETWQWAGAYRAAHTAGANDWAWGHLVVYGLEDPTPSVDKLIAGVRRARRQLVAAGCLTPDHRVKGHQEMPNASTGCPGPLFTNKTWWNQIVAPLDVIDQPSPTPEEPNMAITFFRIEGLPIPVWSTTDGYHAFQVQGPTYQAHGNPAVMTITQAQAAKFSFVDTLHPAVVGVK